MKFLFITLCTVSLSFLCSCNHKKQSRNSLSDSDYVIDLPPIVEVDSEKTFREFKTITKSYDSGALDFEMYGSINMPLIKYRRLGDGRFSLFEMTSYDGDLIYRKTNNKYLDPVISNGSLNFLVGAYKGNDKNETIFSIYAPKTKGIAISGNVSSPGGNALSSEWYSNHRLDFTCQEEECSFLNVNLTITNTETSQSKVIEGKFLVALD